MAINKSHITMQIQFFLSDAGITTKITDEDKERLDRKWVMFKSSVSEEEAVIIHKGDEFGYFCPTPQKGKLSRK